MNAIILSLFFVAVWAEDYDMPKARGNQRSCPMPSNFPRNLMIRTQGKGRIIRFMCPPSTLLIGKRFSTCLRGRWSSPPPICINKGCTPLTAPRNGRLSESYQGAMLTFGCNPGYVQNGTSIIYCDGHQWNGTTPTCTAPTINPNVSCDFEDPDLCGWTHDITHDFEWKRNKLSTPSGHVGTGPSFDHTVGKGLDGHYMYLEASSPRKEGDVSRLFSPTYPPVLSGSCFTFWYHMYGASIGSLRVYLKGEDQVLAELSHSWGQNGETGNVWLQGQVDVPQLATVFQLVIEGVRGADYMGDIAVDDVKLSPGPCPIQTTQSVPIQGSCQTFGCNLTDVESTSCSCSAGCENSGSCCSDYWSVCLRGSMNGTMSTDEGGGGEGGAEEGPTTPLSFTEPTSVHLTNGTTASQPQMTVTREMGFGNTSSVTSGERSTDEFKATTFSERINLTSLVDVPITNTPTAETTAALPEIPKSDCVIETSNSTQTIDDNWVISVYNCSTSSQDNAPSTTAALGTTVVPTTPTFPTTKMITNTPYTSFVTPFYPTQSDTTLTSAAQLTSTANPTPRSTKAGVFPKFITFSQTSRAPKITTAIQKTTTSSTTLTTVSRTSTTLSPNLSSTMRSTAYSGYNLTTTTRVFPFLPIKPLTTTSSSSFHTTGLADTTTSSKTASTTTTASTSVSVPAVTTVGGQTTTYPTTPSSTTATTTTTTTSTVIPTATPSTPTSTRNSFFWIVTKSNQTAITNPVSSNNTTRTAYTSTTTLALPRTSEVPSIPVTTSTTRLSIPAYSPSTTTDLESLFPQSTEEEEEEEEVDEDDDENSRQVDEGNTSSGSGSSDRWVEFPRRPHPTAKPAGGTGVSAVATAAVLGSLVLVVSVFVVYYVINRRRRLVRHRLSSYSEMRFISQREELEFGLADHSDSVKLL